MTNETHLRRGRLRWLTPGLTRGILNTHAYTRAFILLVFKTCFSDVFTLREEEGWMLSRQAFFPQSGVCVFHTCSISTPFHNIASGLAWLHKARPQGWGGGFRGDNVTMVTSITVIITMRIRRRQEIMQHFYYLFCNVDLFYWWLSRCPLLTWRRATGTHWNASTATRTAAIRAVLRQANNYAEMSNREVWCVVFVVSFSYF